MNITILLIIIGILLTTTIISVFLFFKKRLAYQNIYNRYKDVVDIERETIKIKAEAEKAQNEFEKTKKNLQNKENKLKTNYSEKKVIYENLRTEISVLEEDLDYISFGIYQPHYDFDTSDLYKEKTNDVRTKQKLLIKSNRAATCAKEWTVSGSKQEGKKMTQRNIKLMLRAFNGECDAAILKVSWNNANKMEERIRKAFAAINKMGEVQLINISTSYLDLKITELRLAHEMKEKKYAEKEEQRKIREQMREEEKARREIEKAQKDTELEESKYKEALDKAKSEIDKTTGAKLEKMRNKIALMEQRLAEVQKQKERAISRAQITKSGHVYVISNIGSFGEDIYKIGMTRRLDPFDRVKELGDASVPFAFDVHAMIYSDDAPSMESKLHNNFDGARLNLVNKRKEFFKVSLQNIEDVVHKNHGHIEFTRLAEAREFRETESIKDKESNKTIEKQEESRFPDML